MLHFSFKRYLIILVPCILLIGIMVPLNTFAASSTHQAQAVPKNARATFNVTNRCVVEGAQTIVTLNKGQEIEGSAVMTGDDAVHEEEAITLYELDGAGAKLIKANFGSKHFEFTAQHNNDQIEVCYAQTDMDDDGDFNVSQSQFLSVHSATVTYEVESTNNSDSETSSNS